GFLENELPDEGSVLLEDLHAVVGAVADVDQSVVRDAHAVHRVGELRRNRVVHGQLLVARPVAVRAPVALVRPGRRIEHDHALVAVAVGDVELVRYGVDLHVRGTTELRGRVAAFARARVPDLHQELALGRELDDLVVLGVVAADPDVALLIDVDAVLVLEPLVALSRPAPGVQHAAVGVELDDRGRGDAALRAFRLERSAFLLVDQRSRAVDDPHMVARVDGDAGDLAEDPVVGQRLGPGSVDLEAARGLASRGLRAREQRSGGDENSKGILHILSSYLTLPRARNTTSGVMGCCLTFAPSGLNASSPAFMTAPGAPPVPASPAPLA